MKKNISKLTLFLTLIAFHILSCSAKQKPPGADKGVWLSGKELKEQKEAQKKRIVRRYPSKTDKEEGFFRSLGIEEGWDVKGMRRFKESDFSRFRFRSGLKIVLQDSHVGHMELVRFAPNGYYFVTASRDKTIKIWNKEGTLLHTVFISDDVISSLDIAPDSLEIAVGTKFHYFLISPTGDVRQKISREKGNQYHGSYIKYSPRGDRVITFSGYKDVYIRDRNWKKLHKIQASRYKIANIDVHPAGKLFLTAGDASSSRDGWKATVRLWSMEGKLISDIENNKPTSLGEKARNRFDYLPKVYWSEFSPDGKYIGSLAGRKMNIRKLDGELVSSHKTAGSGYGYKFRFSTAERSYYLFSHGKLYKFSLDGQALGKVKLYRREEGGNCIDGDVSSQSNAIVTIHSFGKIKGIVKLFQGDGRHLKTIHQRAKEVRALTISPDQRELVLELLRGKESYIWNTSGNFLSKEKKSFFYNRKGEKISFQLDKWRSTYTFNFRGDEKKYRKRRNKLMLLPDNSIADVSNDQMTLFKIDGTPLRTFKIKAYGRGFGYRYLPVFSPDMSYFIKNSSYGMIILYNMQGEMIRRFKADRYIESGAVSHNGKLIATGHKHGDIHIWTKDGKKVDSYRVHRLEVTDLYFSRNGRYLLSTSKDRTVHIRDLQKKKHLTLVLLKDGDWMVFDQSGRFESSSGARDYVKFVQGMSAFDFEQIWQKFYTPNFIASFVKGRPLRRYDIKREIQNIPIVTIKDFSVDPKKDVVTLKFCVKESKTALGDFFVIHNGRIIDRDFRGLSIKRISNCVSMPILLNAGENRIKGGVYVKNSPIYGSSEPLFLTYKPSRLERPDMYILSIGVSRYQDSSIRLRSPSRDAQELSKILGSMASGLYGKIIKQTLTDSEATRENITSSMQNIIRKAKKRDTVILFMAGHGEVVKSKYYFLPFKADLSRLVQSSMPIQFIDDFARNLKANKLAIFLDTCKSGSATKSLSALAMSRGLSERRIIANLARERGIVVFAAASPSQDAFEIKSLNHGIFTYSMIDALKNHHQEIVHKRMISISKLLSYVSRNTRELAWKHLKMEQNPMLYIFGDDFSLGRAR